MRYNQFDFDYALESMDSVDLSAQSNRLADYGDDEFADAVLEAYEDMYAALEAGDLDEAMDIYTALEEVEENVESDPNVARKAKRKALMKKVAKGTAAIAGTAALAYGGKKGIAKYKAASAAEKGAIRGMGITAAGIGGLSAAFIKSLTNAQKKLITKYEKGSPEERIKIEQSLAHDGDYDTLHHLNMMYTLQMNNRTLVENHTNSINQHLHQHLNHLQDHHIHHIQPFI